MRGDTKSDWSLGVDPYTKRKTFVAACASASTKVKGGKSDF